MTTRHLTRREALALLSVVPAAPSFLGDQGLRDLRVRRVIPGMSHAFILEPDGTLRGWTANTVRGNEHGELGLGHDAVVAPFALAPVPGLRDVTQAAAGRDCSFAIQRNGRLLAWGANTAGILGTTVPAEFARNLVRTADAFAPAPVGVPFEARDISTAGADALAAARDGSAFAWGQGTYGRLGIGSLPVITPPTNVARQVEDVPYPIRIPGLEGVTAVAAGAQHGLALIEDGTVRAWGYNVVGEVGDGTAVQRDAPVPVLGVRNAVAIGAGSGLSVALLADGTVMTWGGHAAGQLGRPGQEKGPNPIPGRVQGVSGVRAIAVGMGHVLALTEAGTVISWGNNAHSAPGNGTGGPVPKPIPRLARVHSIATLFNRSFAVLTDGQIMAWGDYLRVWARPSGAREISPFPRPLDVGGI